MLSKLSTWLKNKTEDQEKSQDDIIDSLVSELNLAYRDCQLALKEAKKNQEDLLTKYEALASEHKDFSNEALKEKNRGNAEKSHLYASRSVLLEEQLNDYKLLLTDVCNTIYQLERQAGKIKLKIDQANSKKTLLSAKLKQAESSITVSQQILEMENSEEFREFEETLKDAEAKTEALAYLNGESFDVPDHYQAADDKKISEQLDRLENNNREASNERLKTTLARVFKNEQPKIDPIQSEKLSHKLEAFKTSKTPLSTKGKLDSINSFFADKEEKSPTGANPNFDIFFSSEKTSPSSISNEVVDKFFEDEPENRSKDPRINDFFKD